jgi:hypothetical protein
LDFFLQDDVWEGDKKDLEFVREYLLGEKLIGMDETEKLAELSHKYGYQPSDNS